MIDRHDAPDGMVAARVTRGCMDCFFYNSENTPDCIDRQSCQSNLRADEESVIFKTRADFEKMLLKEIENFYGKGKVKRIIFTKDNIK